MVLNRRRQYAVVSIIINAITGMVSVENEIVAAISMTSESMLIEGGAPKFLAAKINHQIDITGNRFIMPFKSIKFRLWAVS